MKKLGDAIRRLFGKKMKNLTLILLIAASPCVGYSDVSDRVKLTLRNFVHQSEGCGSATIFVGKEKESFHWAYWKEKKLLMRIPADFSEEAVKHPSLVIRKPLGYPADVREEGNRELETSTYLVAFDWYHDRLIEILIDGEVPLIERIPNQSSLTTPGAAAPSA